MAYKSVRQTIAVTRMEFLLHPASKLGAHNTQLRILTFSVIIGTSESGGVSPSLRGNSNGICNFVAKATRTLSESPDDEASAY